MGSLAFCRGPWESTGQVGRSLGLLNGKQIGGWEAQKEVGRVLVGGDGAGPEPPGQEAGLETLVTLGSNHRLGGISE